MSVAPASTTIGAIIAIVGLLLAGVASPKQAYAYDLGTALAGSPEAKFKSAKLLDHVDHCCEYRT